MLRTIILTLAFGLLVAPASAALIEKTLQGQVEGVATATGVVVGTPVVTVLSFDSSAPVAADLFDVISLQVTLPGGIVLDEADDVLGGFLQVGWDGTRVTNLFAALGIDQAAFGFAGGTLEFLTFGDGSLDFLVANGSGIAFEGTVVPVPAALPLLATGLAALAFVRRRRARSTAA